MKKISHSSEDNSSSKRNNLIPSDIDAIHFPNERYRKVAEIMQKLAILEESLYTNNRLLEVVGIPVDNKVQETKVAIEEAKKSMHDLLLNTHSYPNGQRLVLTASDVEKFGHEDKYGKFDFRDSDAENLAHNLDMIATFQHELAGHFVNRYDLEEGERKAMIQDTTDRLRGHIDHTMNILTGAYEKRRF